MEIKKASLVGILVLLTGCEASEVSEMKNARLYVDKTLTIEQAFDNRKVCDDSQWSSFEDKKGRVVVSYRCDFEIEGELEDHLAASIRPKVEADLQSEIKKSTNRIKSKNYEIEQINKLIKRDPNQAQGYKDKLTKAISEKDELSRQLSLAEENTDDVDSLMDDYIDNRDIEFVADVFQWYLGKNGVPNLVYSGVEVKMKDKEVLKVNYPSARLSYDTVYGNKVENAKEVITQSRDVLSSVLKYWIG